MYLENLINKIKLPFRKDKELYRRLYTILGFYPKNIALYKQALVHKSLTYKKNGGQTENNERLEFLGDAILDAIVGDIVYRHFQGKSEGFLTNTRSKIVQRETLGKLAVEMGIDKLVRYSGQNQAPHSYMAGNAFEALVGAIYLDYGYERCMQFMEKRILSRILNIDKVAYKEVNFKSKLLEWSQKNRIRISFDDREQRNASGNASSFYSDVIIEGILCGSGKGFSKKEAQQNAAKEALVQMKKQKRLEQSVFDAKGKRTAMEEQPQALLPEIPEELLESKPTEKSERKTADASASNRKPKKKVEKKPVEKTAEKVEKKSVDKPVEKAEKKPTDKPVEKKPTVKPAKPIEKVEAPKPVETEEVVAATDELAPTDETVKVSKRRRRRPHHKPKADAGDATGVAPVAEASSVTANE